MYNEDGENEPETRVFLSYDDTYDVASDGTIVNSRTGKELKHAIVNSGHHRVDIHGRHTFVHRLVYQMFGERPLREGEQVNHRNDNKEDNNIENLYAGTQRENIADCIRNSHRKGNLKQLIVRKIDDPGLFRWVQCNHKGPCKRKPGISESEKER